MIRTYDLEVINFYLKQPDILPQFKIAETRHVYDPNFYFMLGNTGLWPCYKQGEVMDCHAAILWKDRGKAAIEEAKELIKWVFSNTDCTKITTRAKKTKKHLLHFNAKILDRCGEDEAYVYYEVFK